MHCSSCGAAVENSSKFCGECGIELAQQTTSRHGAASEHVQARPAETENNICPVCNTAIISGEASLSCSACAIKYHPECWKTNLGCSTYGCPMVGSLKPRNERKVMEPDRKPESQSQTTDKAISSEYFSKSLLSMLKGGNLLDPLKSLTQCSLK